MTKFIFVLALLSSSVYSIEAHAVAHCFCKITTGNSEGSTSPVGTVLKEYSGLSSWNTSIGHNQDCENECISKVNQDSQINSILSQATSTMQAGILISAYSAVGGGKYKKAISVGKVPSVIKNFSGNFSCSLLNKPLPSGCFLFSGQFGNNSMPSSSNLTLSRCINNQIESLLNNSTQFNMGCHRFIYCVDASGTQDRCRFEQQTGVNVNSLSQSPIFTMSNPLNVGCAYPKVLTVGSSRDTCH